MSKLLALLFSTGCLLAQGDAPIGNDATVRSIECFLGGAIGGILDDEQGEEAFCLEVTDYFCRLWSGAIHPGRSGARRLAAGSDEQCRLVERLWAWAETAIPAERRRQLDSVEVVSNKAADYKQASVYHRVARYRAITGSRITDVIAGRGTVELSFRIKDLADRAEVVLFRRDARGLRAYLRDVTEPVAIDSIDERRVLHAMRRFTDDKLSESLRELLWSGAEPAPTDVDQAALRVFSVLVTYAQQTFPRQISAGTLLDGGSFFARFVDVNNQVFELRFDRQIDTKTRERLFFAGDGKQPVLVAFDSAAEVRVLRLLDQFLGRHAEDEHAMLRERLRIYRELQRPQRSGGR